MKNHAPSLARLRAQLDPDEEILVTLYAPSCGLYAATTKRVVSVQRGAVGYSLRVYPYGKITRAWHYATEGEWCIQLNSHGRSLAVPARSEREAEVFVQAIARQLLRRGSSAN